MAIRSGSDDQRSAIQREQAKEQRHQQNQRAALDAHQDLRGELFNPDVIELIGSADMPEGAQSDKTWLHELWEEHLTLDQVLSIYDDREIWEKRWLNPNVADSIITSYPFEEARTENERVKRVRNRIRGDEKEPLTTDQRRKIRALSEQKTDRERRAKDGRFMDRLLVEVVRSEQSTHRDGDESRSLADRVMGR